MSTAPVFRSSASVIDRRRFLRRVAGAAVAVWGGPGGGASAQVSLSATLRGSNIRFRRGAGIEFPARAILQGGPTVTVTGRVQRVQGHLWREAILPTVETGWIAWEPFPGGLPVPGPGEILAEAGGASVVSVEPQPAEEPVQAPPAGHCGMARRPYLMRSAHHVLRCNSAALVASDWERRGRGSVAPAASGKG